MYFKDRAQAGKLLAKKLAAYQPKNCVVVALNRGGVIVGAQIAMQLHANLVMLLTENISLPGLNDSFAALNTNNLMTYNKAFYSGEIEELSSEYYHFIEQQRMEKLHKLHALLGAEGEIQPDLLNRHIVILVSDGLATGFSLDVAMDYLKVIRSKSIVVATPIASVSAVDRMHLVGDDVVCLDVRENFFTTDHYYDDNTLPETDSLFKIMRNISLSWMVSPTAQRISQEHAASRQTA